MTNRDAVRLDRRQFAKAAIGAIGASHCLTPGQDALADDAPTAGFFRLDQRAGRWWFITPQGEPFFSLALNHIDSTPLRSAETISIWRDTYGNSTQRWLAERVRADLTEWGFNGVGWVQEVVIRAPTIHRHSRNFTFEEYQWLGLPYCHMLPFADFHQWEAETRHPDLFSRDFEEWCDYVARDECTRFADDPKLIGYFYIDCPTWVHVRDESSWKGPLFDPAKLATGGGRDQLRRLAARYYQVTHDAIRRYDRNHLILGDRYEAKAPLPDEVFEAAAEFVDVFSFQHFGQVDEIKTYLDRVYRAFGKPVLLADSSGSIDLGNGVRRQNAAKYAATLEALRDVRGCVGFHLCGAYLRNAARQRGLLDDHQRPDEEAIAGIRAANREMRAWAEVASR